MTVAQKRRLNSQARRATRAAANVAKARAMTADNQVASLRVALAMPRSKFARLVGRTDRAVLDWESGKASPQGLSRQRVRELERLTEALGALFAGEALGEWFDTPNPAFGGLKPIEVIERGESDRLWQMVFELRAGTHV
jgi:DNA-binding transcriptional regulator YiaG